MLKLLKALLPFAPSTSQQKICIPMFWGAVAIVSFSQVAKFVLEALALSMPLHLPCWRIPFRLMPFQFPLPKRSSTSSFDVGSERRPPEASSAAAS